MRRTGLTMILGGVSLLAAGAPELAQAQALTDADIAAIVVTANRLDAETGEFAIARAASSGVKQFAETMTRDHRAVIEQAGALVSRLGVTPTANAVTRDLTAGAQSAREGLESLAGRDFDRAYLEHEISFHEAVIRAVDELLIPNARNAELKKAIENVRPALVAHLEHARQLREALE